jgi:hypothetical protein
MLVYYRDTKKKLRNFYIDTDDYYEAIIEVEIFLDNTFEKYFPPILALIQGSKQ